MHVFRGVFCCLRVHHFDAVTKQYFFVGVSVSKSMNKLKKESRNGWKCSTKAVFSFPLLRFQYFSYEVQTKRKTNNKQRWKSRWKKSYPLECWQKTNCKHQMRNQAWFIHLCICSNVNYLQVVAVEKVTSKSVKAKFQKKEKRNKKNSVKRRQKKNLSAFIRLIKTQPATWITENYWRKAYLHGWGKNHSEKLKCLWDKRCEVSKTKDECW